jgi:hypothetical protein
VLGHVIYEVLQRFWVMCDDGYDEQARSKDV